MEYKDFDLKKELSEHTDEDYLGGFLPIENLNEEEDWRPYITAKEYQADKYETWSCVTFSILKAFQAVVYKKYGEKLNLAERFLAVASGTSEGGNSYKYVLQFFRKNGSVNEEDCQFPPTYEEWKNIEDLESLMKIAQNLIPEKYNIQYERISPIKRHNYLKCSPLLISVPAWFLKDDIYYRPDEMSDNHATVEVAKNIVSDTYDPIEKKIDITPSVVYRLYVEKKNDMKDNIKKDYFRFWKIIKTFLGL